MHMRVVEETDLTSADEMLYPSNWSYLSDILSYVAVGARSVENQEHRLTVSGIDIPAGMKNPTSGDLSVMINSVIAAQGSHSFIYRTWEVKTSGNPLAHTILRGATNKHGNSVPNYHYEDIQLLLEKYNETHLVNRLPSSMPTIPTQERNTSSRSVSSKTFCTPDDAIKTSKVS